jgi:hypothetical protein
MRHRYIIAGLFVAVVVFQTPPVQQGVAELINYADERGWVDADKLSWLVSAEANSEAALHNARQPNGWAVARKARPEGGAGAAASAHVEPLVAGGQHRPSGALDPSAPGDLVGMVDGLSLAARGLEGAADGDVLVTGSVDRTATGPGGDSAALVVPDLSIDAAPAADRSSAAISSRPATPRPAAWVATSARTQHPGLSEVAGGDGGKPRPALTCMPDGSPSTFDCLALGRSVIADAAGFVVFAIDVLLETRTAVAGWIPEPADPVRLSLR